MGQLETWEKGRSMEQDLREEFGFFLVPAGTLLFRKKEHGNLDPRPPCMFFYLDSNQVRNEDRHRVWRTTRELQVISPVCLKHSNAWFSCSRLGELFDAVGVRVSSKNDLALKHSGGTFPNVMKRLAKVGIDGVFQPVEDPGAISLELVLSDPETIKVEEKFDFRKRYLSWSKFQQRKPLPCVTAWTLDQHLRFVSSWRKLWQRQKWNGIVHPFFRPYP